MSPAPLARSAARVPAFDGSAAVARLDEAVRNEVERRCAQMPGPDAARVASFVLVHGAAHGGWAWDRLRPCLQAYGHEAVAPDLPGAGDDPMPTGDVTLADYRDRIVARVDAAPRPVVLVGHSMGGVTLSEVCEARPERIACAVYVTAFMLRDGECARDVTRVDEHPEILDAIDFDGGPDARSYVYRPAVARGVFYDGCRDDDAEAALARLRPMPRLIAQTRVRTTMARAGRVPRVYVQCDRDRAIPPHLQRLMCERLPPWRVVHMDCGHSPFLAAPGELARHLHEAALAATAGASWSGA